MMVVPYAARFTCVVDPPIADTVKGVPASLTKFTGNETAVPVRFVKYSAEYQPPPNANCGSTLDLEVVSALPVVGMEVKANLSKRSPSTATLPSDTENSAEPRSPTIPLRPGRLRKVVAVLPVGGGGTGVDDRHGGDEGRLVPRKRIRSSSRVGQLHHGFLIGLPGHALPEHPVAEHSGRKSERRVSLDQATHVGRLDEGRAVCCQVHVRRGSPENRYV